MRKIFYFLLFIFLSCGNDDNSESKNDFTGYYKIVSISSETPIDLNNDDIKTQDYLQEITSDFITHNGEVVSNFYNPNNISHYAQITPMSYQSTTAKFISFNFPFQVIDSLFMGNENYINILMHYTKGLSYVGYKISNNGEVVLDNADIEYTFSFYNANFVDFKRTSKTTFKLVFEKEVYDFSEDTWINTRLSTVYKKIEVE